jgi:hypothetical protein
MLRLLSYIYGWGNAPGYRGDVLIPWLFFGRVHLISMGWCVVQIGRWMAML